MYQQCRGIATKPGCEALKQSDFTGIHSDDGRLWGVCNHRDSYEIDGQFLPKFACPNPMWKQLKRWVQMHSESIKNQGQSLSTLTKTDLSNLPLYIYPCWLVTVVPRTARQWHKAEMLLDQARKTKPTMNFCGVIFWSSSWLADVMISIYAFVTPFSSFFMFFCCANKEKTPRSQWVRIKALPFPSMRSWPVTMGNHGSWDLVKCESWVLIWSFKPQFVLLRGRGFLLEKANRMPKCVVDCQSIGCMYCVYIYIYIWIDYV